MCQALETAYAALKATHKRRKPRPGGEEAENIRRSATFQKRKTKTIVAMQETGDHIEILKNPSPDSGIREATVETMGANSVKLNSGKPR
mmetsp:Transcript_34699/g.48094  ORF Transcript_34699/g.48094 Transcript_34699/m.48094 type:complete len:89 (-) Transcript_34699:203-469(-)